MSKPRNTNNSADDEFGFDYNISEEEFNKSHRKALKKVDSSYKDIWVKIAEGLYEKQTKIVKKKKMKMKKKEHNWFKGLGSSSRGPGNR